MAQDWLELTRLTGSSPLVIEQVRITDKDILISGEFELPPMARLSAEDQVFVMAFVRCHGSIKEMESSFGISYPTVKNRLTRIAQQFEFAENVPVTPVVTGEDILAKLERGEISASEAIERLEK
jgi:hypothetical protein